MESKPTMWIVYDSITKIQSQPLTAEQLQMAVLRMHEKDWDRFHIWTESWENWQPLRAFLKNNQNNFLNVINIPSKRMSEETIKRQIEKNMDPLKSSKSIHDTVTKSATKVRTSSEFTKTSFNTDSNVADMDLLNLESIKPPTDIDFKKISSKGYKHRSTRHELKIELILVAKNGRTFRSYSQNISLSGSLLEDNIPFEFSGNVFELLVVNRFAKDPQLARLSLKGKIVGEGISRRIQFEGMSDQLNNKLTALLNEYTENQKKFSRKDSA